MIRTTFYKLKKACYTLTLAPRVLLRGEMRYTPGKFQKLSITVLRKAEKSTASGSDKEEECEKCKKLIELIFGPSNPEAIQGLNKTELPDTDIHHINETHKEKLAQIIAPQVHEAKAQAEMSDRVFSEKFGTEEVLEKTDMPIDTHMHATSAKQTEEQLAQKLEVVNETPVVEAEIPKAHGFNVPPKVLGNAEEIQSYYKHDSRKWNELDDIRVYTAKPEAVADNIKMRDTIENLVRKIEETYRLEDLRKKEDFRRVERALSKEIERSDFKLPIYNFASDGQNRKSGASGAAAETNTYDELAKRCLDAPNSKIDERILKEMKKLAVPQTSLRGDSSIIEENIMQIDLKKPRKPAQKTEIDLETREFERDPPIAYVDKLHPAFQTANYPKSITDENPNMEKLTSEGVQVYELDNKPLTYSETAEDECVNFESKPYDTSRVIIDPYDKRSIAFDNEEEEYDPLWYERYTIRQEKELNMNKDGEPSEMQNNAVKYTSHNQAQYLQTGTKQESFTDQSREEAGTYKAVESQTTEQYSENLSTPIFQNKTSLDENARESEKFSFKPNHVAEVAAETNLKEDEIIQLSVLIDPDEAGRVTSDSFDPKKDSIAQRASMKFEKASIEPEKTSVEFERATIGHKKGFEPERGSNEFERTSVQPQTAAHIHETYQNYSQPPVQTIDPNATKGNLEYHRHFNTPSPSINTPKHPDETYQFITRPEPSPTSEPAQNHNTNLGYETSEAELLPESLTQTKPFQYSTPPESASDNNQDVTYIEPKAPEESLEKPERENHNLTPEQISHSFVQPQSNPLNSQPLEGPSEKIQKTMSACNMPDLQPQEEISLSEMLKRVRLRNQMKYCQAIDRQLGQLEPVTGKCGKKTPPCPPPAPKCPQCPPPPCPPPPPPCPKPCKPACPPPCPPPKKDPCRKFKKHLPGINLKSIISMLLQSSDLQNPKSLNLCVRISERSHVIAVKEMSLKMQEIGLNLLIVYPRKIDVQLSRNIGETVTLARDYEPWVPIPSWPIPKKEIKRPFVCPKEGCKLIPPPKLRPPCNENPCINFPKRSNSFSIAQLFSFYLGDNVVFDIIN